MVEQVDELVNNCNKLAISLDLYDEIKAIEVKSHDEYIINYSKLKFLKKEILELSNNITKITKSQERIAKRHIQ